MSTEDATDKVEEHEAKIQAGGDRLQAQSERKLGEMSDASKDKGKDSETARDNRESKPASAADDQPDAPDPS